MADTGERREIKVRTDAKEAEVVVESKKLLQASLTTTDQTLRRRDRVNKKVMADKRLADMMNPKTLPFDAKRMIYGGFASLVKA